MRNGQVSRHMLQLLLLLSCFSHVRLCATPQMAAHQAPLCVGFSRQEYWSGLPFPSPFYSTPKLNQEDIENQNRLITRNEIESVIEKKKIPTQKSPGPDGFTGELYPTKKEELIPILKFFQKIEAKGIFPKTFHKATIILISKTSKRYYQK